MCKVNLLNFDIKELIIKLNLKRKVFSNEKDLQVAVCVLLHEVFSNRKFLVVPEFFFNGPNFANTNSTAPYIYDNSKDCKCDIIVLDNTNLNAIAIELKYKTIADKNKTGHLNIIFDSNNLKGSEDLPSYSLTNQGASDNGCLFILEDFKRLQFLLENKITLGSKEIHVIRGFSLNITNDHLYWTKPNNTKKNNKQKVAIFYPKCLFSNPYIISGYSIDKLNIYFDVKVPAKFVWY